MHVVRYRRGWPRWMVGVLSGALLFGAASLVVSVVASASMRSPSFSARVDLPVPTPSLPIATPTLSLPVPTPTLPIPTPTLSLPPTPTALPTPTNCILSICLPPPPPIPPVNPGPCVAGLCPPSGGNPPPCLLLCGNNSGGTTPVVGTNGGSSAAGSSALPGAPGSTDSSSIAASGISGVDSLAGSSGARSGSQPGISFTPPPPIQLTSPVAGIAFGKAPFLWPLFAVLDVLLIGAGVVVFRKTWSRSGSD